MAAADVPKWGFGQEPIKMSMEFNLATPCSHTRQPAWERVSTQSHPATGKTMKIMKRVGLPTERRAVPKPSAVFLPPVVPSRTREDIGLDQLSARKARRGDSFVPAFGETDVCGKPDSRAQCYSSELQAKVNVANNFLATASGPTFQDIKAARRGIRQISPRKRPADISDNIDTPVHMARVGGNKLTIFHSLRPIISRALQSGKHEIDLATASVAEFAHFMRRLRRNPRKYIAAAGVPDLSAIQDESEPESPTVVRQPKIKAESRSPQKRIARLAQPFKKGANRLADGFVQLMPGPIHKADPSPHKSTAAPSSPVPSSPLMHSTSPMLPIIKPARIDSSPVFESAGTAEENEFSESHALDSSPTRPGRTFCVPSEFDSSSVDENTQCPPETPTKPTSPVNYSRPVAPTPSQWNRAEPSTPFTPKPQSAGPTTPSQTSSPIGLASLYLPSTPKLPQSTYDSPSRVGSFEFGKASPFQGDISWMNSSVQTSEPKRIKSVNQGRRRQSEPLFRKYLDSQARRRSSSPQKVRYQDEDTFRDVISIASLFDSIVTTPAKTATSTPSVDETTVVVETAINETISSDTNAGNVDDSSNDEVFTLIEPAAIEEATELPNIEPADTTADAPGVDIRATQTASNELATQTPADEEVPSTIEHEATNEVSNLPEPDSTDVHMDLTTLESSVNETAVACTGAVETASTEPTEVLTIEAGIEDTPINDNIVMELEPEVTQDVSNLPKSESTTVAIDSAPTESLADETAPTETTQASAIETGVEGTAIDDNVVMELEYEATESHANETETTEVLAIETGVQETPNDDNIIMQLEPKATNDVFDLANSTDPAAAESTIDSNSITAIHPSPIEALAHTQADEDMTEDINDVSEALTVIVRTPTENDMDDIAPAPENKNREPIPVEQAVVEIDMRENPDIFGIHVSSPPAPIRNLSRMAGDACSGLAKVVVTEENGRLFVRFKLSAQYAHIFPASQGFDDSQLALSPSAISHSPRISFDSNRIQAQPEISSPAKVDDTSIAARRSPINEMTKTPNISAFARSPSNESQFRTPELPASNSTIMFGSPAGGLSPAFEYSTPNPRSIESLLRTPDASGFGNANQGLNDEFKTPELPPSDNTLMFASAKPMSTKRTPRRQSAMTPLKQALSNTVGTQRPITPQVPTTFNHNTPKFATPIDDAADRTLPMSWSDVQDSPNDEPLEQAIEAPGTQPTTTDPAPAQEAQAAPTADQTSQDFDSPDREFVRNFIKRSRLASNTTDAGSPAALTTRRQPLSVRSPNRISPLKPKRKHQEDVDDNVQSPLKKVKVEDDSQTDTQKPAPKKGRRTKNSRQKSELEIDMNDLPTTTAATPTATTDDKQANELGAVTPATRRSSRLRVQDSASGAPKSSLPTPTPIKLNRAGAGRNGGANLKKARTEDQELDRKTRSNTKKNMGDAEFPPEVLVRLAGQGEEDSDVGQESEGSAGGRRVGWKTPLAKFQGESPKKGRAAPKGKATQGQTGISKPKSTGKSTPKAKQATKVAEDLGMVANGTPAKPQRVTRSRARSGV
ncbi:hypothetical protein FHETE_4909 [Fusarium heterosporum]|uniref:Uncharacterized protein n=1 Tax=Fusarium heterosporum TaxID=42747 RepID=A0A8H5THB2_FUSHE|nr:hypothetical protein FHETE_4909 [Fusarium heterosporum]